MNDSQPPFSGFTESSQAGLQLPSWERRQRFGLLNSLYLTIKDVLLIPGRFFQQMPSQVGIIQPLLFALILGTAGTLIAWLYSLVSSSLQIVLFGDFTHGRNSLVPLLLFVSSPLWMTIGIFIQAGLIHAALTLLGGNRLGFEATFRVSAYSEATSILLLLPICGSWVAIIWSMVILIVGLYNIHGTAPWKAVMAVLVPLLLCFSTIGGSVATLMTSIN